MACFLVPAAEAIVTTAITKAIEGKTERRAAEAARQAAGKEPPAPREAGSVKTALPLARKLKWLSYMLWGGAALLAFEHLWHGEVIPRFPFLTAAGDPADRAAMLHEMATAGLAMAILVTAVWAGMVIAAGVMQKRILKARAMAGRQEV